MLNDDITNKDFKLSALVKNLPIDQEIEEVYGKNESIDNLKDDTVPAFFQSDYLGKNSEDSFSTSQSSVSI